MNSTPKRSSSRARDFAPYVAISLAVGALVLALARSNLNQAAAKQWFSLAFYSAFLYGVFISANWSSRRSRHFWLVVVAAFLLHAAIFAVAIIKIPYWRSIWDVIMFLELPLLDRAQARFAPVRKRVH